MNVRRLTPILLALILLLVVAPACRPQVIDPISPRVLILSPIAEGAIQDTEVTVRVYVQNFELVPLGQDAAAYASGHLIYYMDVPAPQRPGQDATTAEGTYFATTETSHTWTGVSPGKHVFSVQLVGGDNTTLDPPEIVRVPITVE